jgi:acrylyl-CoA reductase (NADPH)
MSFRALVLSQAADRKVSGAVETLPVDKLPAGDVTVAVEYSTLNYKDGLVLTTGGGLVKNWPHVGGIDFSGTVESSQIRNSPGDKVVERLAGGQAALGRLCHQGARKGDWLVKLPPAISPSAPWHPGTAGYTRCSRDGAGEARIRPAAGGSW